MLHTLSNSSFINIDDFKDTGGACPVGIFKTTMDLTISSNVSGGRSGHLDVESGGDNRSVR